MGDVSHAWKDPALRQDAPVSLKRLRALRVPFDHARDPLISAQIKDLERGQSQHRDESGGGSAMVKKDRPHPELRPRHEPAPLRASVSQAWLREQRTARLSAYKAQEQHRTGSAVRPGSAPERQR